MWVFGYGSLTWKTEFTYNRRVVGYIKGYHRRFWQASIDHRGTHEKPGRVATLVPAEDPEAKVWGVAYNITDSVEEANASLDTREKRYDNRKLIPIYQKGGTKLADPVLVYVGTSNPELVLGPAPLSQMAEQIANSKGPSGLNRDYLFSLARFMREEAPEASDPHLFELEEAVMHLLKTNTGTGSS